METKTQKVIRWFEEGDTRKAMRHASKFRIGISKEDQDAMGFAYDCMLNADFYRQLGKDPVEIIDKGLEVFTQLFINTKK